MVWFDLYCINMCVLHLLTLWLRLIRIAIGLRLRMITHHEVVV